MMIVSESLKSLEKKVVAVEKEVLKTVKRWQKIDFAAFFARIRSAFAFAGQRELRDLIAKVDELEAKLDKMRGARA
jgi:hypothetical protein